MNHWSAAEATGELSEVAEFFWLTEPSPTGRFDAVADGRFDIAFALSPSNPRIEVHGAVTVPKVMELEAGVRYAGFRLRPEWGGAFLGDEAARAANAVAPLDRLGSWRADLLAEILAAARSAADLEPLLRPFIRERAGKASAGARWARVACASVRQESGALRIEALAARVGMSRRALERVFKSEVGVAPKVFSRIERLSRLARSARESTRGWAQLAADLGYADQAHLVREVAQLTGKTPTEFRQRARSMPRGWV